MSQLLIAVIVTHHIFYCDFARLQSQMTITSIRAMAATARLAELRAPGAAADCKPWMMTCACAQITIRVILFRICLDIAALITTIWQSIAAASLCSFYFFVLDL